MLEWLDCVSDLSLYFHYVVDGEVEGVGKGLGGGVGVDGVAVRRGGVEGDGGEMGLAQRHKGATTTDEVVIDLGGDEKLGEVADDKGDLLYLLFGGEDL